MYVPTTFPRQYPAKEKKNEKKDQKSKGSLLQPSGRVPPQRFQGSYVLCAAMNSRAIQAQLGDLLFLQGKGRDKPRTKEKKIPRGEEKQNRTQGVSCGQVRNQRLNRCWMEMVYLSAQVVVDGVGWRCLFIVLEGVVASWSMEWL